MALIPLEGRKGESGGQALRAALTLSAVTGQGFVMTRIRANRTRSGLAPQHVVTVRAAALACSARVGGLFEGSPDLRFEPGLVSPGEFRFEVGTAGATSFVLQTLLPVLATGPAASHIFVTGGTHVPVAPSFHYVAEHWAAVVGRLGLRTEHRLLTAGFHPKGGGEVRSGVTPWTRPAAALVLDERGPLLGLRGTSGAGRVKGAPAARVRDAVAGRLWEDRRLEAEWTVLDLQAAGPGSFLLLEAVFKNGRAAFPYLGERGLRPEVLGDRAARRLLKFLESSEGAVDPLLADQLVVPLALGGGGGRITTPEVTRHLETVVAVAVAFGFSAATFGRSGGPGGVEVARC
jgi:RNA 3'-terminal phosphate cyclase (ATP)